MTIYEEAYIRAIRENTEAIHLLRADLAAFMTQYKKPQVTGMADAGPEDIPPGKWVDEPATGKQINFLEKNNIPFSIPISKGDASQLIDQYIQSHKK